MHRHQAQEPPEAGQGPAEATDAQLKTQCKQEYEQLRDQVLQLLISFQWIQGEAKDQGIKVTDAEVKKSFDKQKKQCFPKDADYQKFLKDSGQTEEDILCASGSTCSRTRSATRSTKGKDKVTDAADRGLLQQEQGAASPSPSGATCTSS